MTEQGEQIIELGRQRKTYKDALEDLVQHIESVFHQDWAHTLSCFIARLLLPGGTSLGEKSGKII
jgi:hypothetical protein